MLYPKVKQAFAKLRSLFEPAKGVEINTLEEILIQADVGAKYAKLIVDKVKNQQNHATSLKNELIRLLYLPKPDIVQEPPIVIMICGINGSGKTTTLAKLARRYREKGSVLLASADTYRDAASEQLEIWAERTNVEIVASQKGQDAGAVVFDALSKAKNKSIETVLIDTAGRLHTSTNLIEELKKIKRVVTKFKPEGPDLNLLTIDATLGQNSIQQARVFTRELGINGIILTKFDGTAKGGAIIPICRELQIPVLYLGIGEDADDLVEFEAGEFVEALFESQ